MVPSVFDSPVIKTPSSSPVSSFSAGSVVSPPSESQDYKLSQPARRQDCGSATDLKLLQPASQDCGPQPRRGCGERQSAKDFNLSQPARRQDCGSQPCCGCGQCQSCKDFKPSQTCGSRSRFGRDLGLPSCIGTNVQAKTGRKRSALSPSCPSSPRRVKLNSQYGLLRGCNSVARASFRLSKYNGFRRKKNFDIDEFSCVYCKKDGHDVSFCPSLPTEVTEEEKIPFVENLLDAPKEDPNVYA